FSSRRRHTIFSRDWSSDVCSSDLFVDLTGETVAWAIDHELQLFYTLDGGINWERKVSPCSSIETLASWSASFISSHEGWFICGSDEGMGGQSKTLLRTEDAAGSSPNLSVKSRPR